MSIAPEVHELQVLAEAAKVPLYHALTKAGVSRSTYWRWVNENKEPLTGTIRKVRAAIIELARAA